MMSQQKKLQRHMKKCMVAELGPELNEKVYNLILRMVEYDPEKRISLD